MKAATLDNLLYGEPKIYAEDEIQKTVSGPRSRPVFDYIKNKNENGVMPTLKIFQPM